MTAQKDVLSEIVALLHPHTVLARMTSGRGTWGVRFDGYISPLYGRTSPAFCIVLSGQCWVTFENTTPMMLRRGDFLFLRNSVPFKISSDLNVHCAPVLYYETRYGEQGGDPDMEMLGGIFNIDSNNAELLLNLLPEMLHIRSTENDTTALASIINLIMKECIDNKPGQDMVLARLMDVMLIAALRWQSYEVGSTRSSLLAGLQYPPIAHTLRAMHSNVNYDWTVAALAKHAGMSRSAYAKRFGEIVGCGPMEYLTRWRISLAQDALVRGSEPLETIARKVGYRSAATLSSAFHRIAGNSPRDFRRLSRTKQSNAN